jgi:hypothetical protein
MKLKDWREVLDLDFPKMGEVTIETRRAMREYGRRYLMGNFRLATGRIHTDREYEYWRERVLATPLP